MLSVGTVILEEKVSNGIVSQLRDGLQTPLVEQCPIEPLPDLNVCITVSEFMVLLGRKHHAEQCLSKHAAMFDIVGSVCSRPSRTPAVMPWWAIAMNLSGQPILDMILQSLSLLTVSKAFARPWS